jgi:ComF family protein
MKSDAPGGAQQARGFPAKLLEAAAELLYPSSLYCVACGNLIDASRPYALCDTCRSEIAWHRGALPSGHEFRNGWSCVQYSGPIKNMVRDMKYHDRPSTAKNIAEIMADRAAGEDGIMSADIIVPVPMYHAKKRKRGYNQTELIAADLAQRLGIRYAPDILVKTKMTEAMSSKNSDERRLMLTDAFAVNDDAGSRAAPDAAPADAASSRVHAAHILLIDDVFTTGSTADACARTLREAGAASVDLFVFATGALALSGGFGDESGLK